MSSRDVSFTRKLATRLEKIGNRLCVGVDPHLASLPSFFQDQLQIKGPEYFIEQFCEVLMAGAKGKSAILKFQSAFFEAHGPSGFAVLQKAMKKAQAEGFLTILDAKRGDIASTMAAYGQMAFEAFAADALTITPYMGIDVLSPLTPWLKAGRGVYVVWISSNPSGAALQNLSVSTESGSRLLNEVLFDYLWREAKHLEITSAMGLVLGTTKLEDLSPQLLKKIAPLSLLMPGVGPQGGKIDQALKVLLAESPASIVPMSRAICGFGDASQSSSLGKMKSWSDYQSYVSERASEAAQSLSF